MEAVVLFKNKYIIKTYSQPQGGWFLSAETMESIISTWPWDESWDWEHQFRKSVDGFGAGAPSAWYVYKRVINPSSFYIGWVLMATML